MTRLTYTLAELREALQQPSEYLARRMVRALEVGHGFPRPLPHVTPGTHLLWSKPAVDRWFEAWGEASGATGAIDAITRQMEETYQ